MSMTFLILLLVVVGFILARANARGFSLLFFMAAVILFINTPAGKPLPGNIANFIQDASNSTAPLTGGAG